jgi:Uma2 family endonuclease
MVAMAALYEDLPVRPDGFTIDDLEQLPDDGRRYELVDGVLIVSPAPRWEHQAGVVFLNRVLDRASPDEVLVFPASPDVRSGRSTSLQPDISVIRVTDLVPGRPYLGRPVLAIEVLSPSTRMVDWGLKRAVYARLGIGHYWIVDVDKPSVTALALVDGQYVEVASAVGEEPLTVREPFPVTVVPVDLRLPPPE